MPKLLLPVHISRIHDCTRFFIKSWSVLGKLVWPQATQLNFSVFIGKTAILLLLEGFVYGHITEDRKRKRHSTRWKLNPLPLCYGACALPLCCNRRGTALAYSWYHFHSFFVTLHFSKPIGSRFLVEFLLTKVQTILFGCFPCQSFSDNYERTFSLFSIHCQK